MKTELVCSECGSKGEGSCDCGAAYMPKKMRKAIEAIKADPARSIRAIAKETGVSKSYVGRIHKPGVPKKGTPEKRIGKDGKSYPAVATKRKGVRPFTKDNGRTEMVNLSCWFDLIRAKLKERFDRVLKEASKTKEFGEQTRAVLIDDINYLKQDLDRWIAQLDAIELPPEEETNVVPLRRRLKK